MPHVHEFVAHVKNDHSGPAGDGSRTFRFSSKSKALKEAEGKVYYGKPAEVTTSEVSAQLMSRWRQEGKIS